MLAIFAVSDPLAIRAFGLFAITLAAGRICCGCTCPQRVWRKSTARTRRAADEGIAGQPIRPRITK
ncbi:hypothetical protein D3C78_1870750 [compost metagenome]